MYAKVAVLGLVGMMSYAGCKARTQNYDRVKQDAKGCADKAFPMVPRTQWPTNSITFCFDQNLNQNLKDAFLFAANRAVDSKVNWTFDLIPNSNCANNWPNSRPNFPGTMEGNIRVRMESMGATGKGPIAYDLPTQDQMDLPRAPGQKNGNGILGLFIRTEFEQNFLKHGEIVFNSDALWSSEVGGKGYDPRDVAMHEIGHMFGLDHESCAYTDDVTAIPVGSSTGERIPEAVAIQAGANKRFDGEILGDDQIDQETMDILVGPNFIADSGVPLNVMEPIAVMDRHGVNPKKGQQPDASFNYAPRELDGMRRNAARGQ